MVKFIAGIAVGLAFMQFFTTKDGKVLKDKLFKYIDEQTETDNATDTIIDIPIEQDKVEDV